MPLCPKNVFKMLCYLISVVGGEINDECNMGFVCDILLESSLTSHMDIRYWRM